VPGLESVVIVGASLAGLRAAEALRRAGFAGTLTLVGAEHHLPYDRPPLSKQLLLGTWEVERTALSSQEGIDKLALDLQLGIAATKLDVRRREVHLADGGRVGFDGLIIATGATPRRLPGQPDLPGVHMLRTLDDSLAVRAAFDAGARVAVIGAGFIGCEVAACARQRGLDVTVIEVLSQPLERTLGFQVGAAAAGIHRGHGVEFRLGTSVVGFEGRDRLEGVRLGDGSVVPADVAVIGIGVAPETGWLQDSGLMLRDGVVCNAALESSVEDIFAAGDVCRWENPLFGAEMRVEHWTNAVQQGMAAARNLLAPRDERRPFPSVPYVWSDQYDFTIMAIGHCSAPDVVEIKHGSLESGRFVALYGRNGRLEMAVGFGMPAELNAYRGLVVRASFADALDHELPED